MQYHPYNREISLWLMSTVESVRMNQVPGKMVPKGGKNMSNEAIEDELSDISDLFSTYGNEYTTSALLSGE